MTKAQMQSTVIPYTLYDTFADYLAGLLEQFGDKPALSWFNRKKEETCYTYRELIEKVYQLRQALYHLGISSGSHVAIVSENSADWIITFLAITSSGATAVCVDTEQSDDSIRDMIRRCDAKVIFLSPTFFDLCLPIYSSIAISRLFFLAASESSLSGLLLLLFFDLVQQ